MEPAVPVRLRELLLKLATPETAALVVVPPRVADPVEVTVTVAVELVTVLPSWSWIVITGWVLNAALFTKPDAGVVNAICVATPWVRVNAVC